MIFTSERPPIIRLSLGVIPWPDITTKAPYITIVEESGTGDPVTITGSRDFVNVPGTPIWYWSASGKVTIPDTDTKWLYYVTRGNGGEIIAEGTMEIYQKNFFGKTKVVEAHFMCPGAVEAPPSVGSTKTYPIRFVGYGQDGNAIVFDTCTVTATWSNPTGVPAVGESNPQAQDMDLNADNSYQFDWVIPYTIGLNLVTLTITVTSGDMEASYHKFVEIFRKTEFNPVRAANGVVI